MTILMCILAFLNGLVGCLVIQSASRAEEQPVRVIGGGIALISLLTSVYLIAYATGFITA